jgi:isoleucyl-tRNA synthetase
VQLLRACAPITPFLAEFLWQRLVTERCEDAPSSVFLAGWPRRSAEAADEELLAEIATVRKVVQVARRARGEAGLKLRQPLRQAFVRGGDAAATHAEEIAEELRVKEIAFGAGPVAKARLLPNLPLLGPRLGPKLPQIRAALDAGEFEEGENGEVHVAGEVLGAEEVIRGERIALEGWAIAEDDGISVAFDTTLDDELEIEGRVYDLIHQLNGLRRDQGFELTDRIAVALPERDADLLAGHAEWIKREALARRLELDPSLEQPAISRL